MKSCGPDDGMCLWLPGQQNCLWASKMPSVWRLARSPTTTWRTSHKHNCMTMMSSLKPKVYNLSHNIRGGPSYCYRQHTEKIWWRFALQFLSYACRQTHKQTDRQTDIFITILRKVTQWSNDHFAAFVWNCMCEPVPEEIFTHSSPTHTPIADQVPPYTMIHSILNVQFTCLTAWQSLCTTSFQVLFSLPHDLQPSTSYSTFFTRSLSSFATYSDIFITILCNLMQQSNNNHFCDPLSIPWQPVLL